MLVIINGMTSGRCIQDLTEEEQNRLYGPPVSKLNHEDFIRRINAENDKPSVKRNNDLSGLFRVCSP